MRLFRVLLGSSLLFLLFLTVGYLFLAPQSTVGHCPGQFVKHAAFNQVESRLIVVTMPQLPFG